MAIHWLFALALPLAVQAAPVTAPKPAPTPAAESPPLPRVEVTTTAGRFVLVLETKRAPITAANFLRYVDGRRLDGVTFYRIAKAGPRYGFVQFGPDGNPKRILPPIKHEPTTQTGVKHLDGTISIARLAPGTARSEFTISLGDQPGLDADPTKPGDNLGYAAFGHVVEGMDVVATILDTPVDPQATVRGAFKGEVPAKPVRVLTVRRVASSGGATISGQ
ncbi:MAG TPA: peptidylprolyl isomerase [Sphingomonas sp.]|jgi:peptidyl-prolyl cis-trans isomerase A (cyclophilin A)|nr:peptidylprolyl isomerase [Sphingomonas sp.]